MKRIKLILITAIMFVGSIGNSQISGEETEVRHDGIVTGVLQLGSQEFAGITNLTVGTTYKTSLYTAGLLSVGEQVVLVLRDENNFNEGYIETLGTKIRIYLNNPTDTIDPIDPNYNPEDVYKFLGELHNLGLDYVIDQLLIDKANGLDVSNIDSVLISVKQHTVELTSILLEEIGCNIDYAAVIQRSSDLALFEENHLNLYSPSLKGLTEAEKEGLDFLSSMIVVGDYSKTKENLEYMNTLLRCSSNAGNLIDKKILAVEVLLHSNEYWNNPEKIGKWKDLVRDSVDPDVLAGAFWQNFGAADAGGAVATAITIGAASIVTGPPGWVAGGIIVAGGTVGASAGYAVATWISSW